MKHKKAIKAVKKLKRYCKERDCEDCVFNIKKDMEDLCDRYFLISPIEWNVKELKNGKRQID